MKVLALIQARMGSTRLPGKVMKKIKDRTIIEILLHRISKANLISDIVIATSIQSENNLLAEHVESLGYPVYRGSENDVLDRFYQAANLHQADYVVRITADCPLVDPGLIDSVIEYTIKKQVDYGSNILIESFPDGQDIEVFSINSLRTAWKNAIVLSDREHVTPYIKKKSDFYNETLFTAKNFVNEKNLGHIRMTVDEINDFEAIETLISKLGINETWQKYADYILTNISEFKNQDIKRNEGYLKPLINDKLN